MKKPTKKLSLNAETVRVMTSDQLQGAAGGGVSLVSQRNTTCYCPVLTNGCGITQACTGTISSGTSVINPSGG